MKHLDIKGFSAPVIMVLFLLIASVGTAGWLVYDKQTTEKTPAPTAKATNQQTTIKDAEFDIDQFHDQVQIGMEYDEVVSLANGQTGICEMSNAPPPTDYMYCTWQDDGSVETISFKNQKVTTKTQDKL